MREIFTNPTIRAILKIFLILMALDFTIKMFLTKPAVQAPAEKKVKRAAAAEAESSPSVVDTATGETIEIERTHQTGNSLPSANRSGIFFY